MTNLEKAKELLDNSVPTSESESIDGVFFYAAFKAIEIAAKIDWRNPKKELPINNQQTNIIIIVAFEKSTTVGVYLDEKFCNLRDYKPFPLEVVAWCELPVFNNT